MWRDVIVMQMASPNGRELIKGDYDDKFVVNLATWLDIQQIGRCDDTLKQVLNVRLIDKSSLFQVKIWSQTGYKP